MGCILCFYRNEPPKIFSQLSKKGENQQASKPINQNQEAENKKPKTKSMISHSGIQNLGNTCFMNSVLQALVHTPGLDEFLIQDKPVTNHLMQVFKSIKTKRDLMNSMMSFIDTISSFNHIWKDRKPQDSKEFLIFLMNCLLNEGNDLGHVMWKYEKILSISCSHIETINEKYYFLSLYSANIRQEIQRVIESKSKVVEFENYFCSLCKKPRKCTESYKILNAPNIMVFYIDPRKSLNVSLRDIKKVDCLDYKLSLYCLIITVQLNIRHFKAVCKEKHRWLVYDDDKVESISRKSKIDGIYLLFYKIRSKNA